MSLHGTASTRGGRETSRPPAGVEHPPAAALPVPGSTPDTRWRRRLSPCGMRPPGVGSVPLCTAGKDQQRSLRHPFPIPFHVRWRSVIAGPADSADSTARPRNPLCERRLHADDHAAEGWSSPPTTMTSASAAASTRPTRTAPGARCSSGGSRSRWCCATRVGCWLWTWARGYDIRLEIGERCAECGTTYADDLVPFAAMAQTLYAATADGSAYDREDFGAFC